MTSYVNGLGFNGGIFYSLMNLHDADVLKYEIDWKCLFVQH